MVHGIREGKIVWSRPEIVVIIDNENTSQARLQLATFAESYRINRHNNLSSSFSPKELHC